MANYTKATPKRQTEFLEQLSRDANVSRSCDAVRLSRSIVYKWKKADSEFAEKWEEAINLGVGALEDEAVKRALKGSDTLLIFLLKANKPEKYSDRVKQDVSGAVTVVVEWPVEPDKS